MNETVAKLPEYPVVMGIKGVGPSLGPHLMAKIRDVTCFTHKGAITAFTGVDPGVNESGTYKQKKCSDFQTWLIFPKKNLISGHGLSHQNETAG